MDKMLELHLLTSGLRFNPEVFFHYFVVPTKIGCGSE